eukprot:GEMP01041989.1.p1 GENE.GEMP01041989.1~~GEMP01041989.1.p1  ORF type:complete len:582 (+),score=104.45 GEMP01041989.1:59-1747(+)
MTRVAVRTGSEDSALRGQLSISFLYEGRALALNRNISENLGVTLRRVGLSLEKKGKSKKKDKTAGLRDTSPTPLIAVHLEGPNGRISDDEPLLEAMKAATSMHVGDFIYAVDYNAPLPPKLKDVRLPESVIATCPVTAVLLSENVDGDCSYEWRIVGEDEIVGQQATFSPSAKMGGKVLNVRVSHPECLNAVSSTCTVAKWNDDDIYSTDRLTNFVKQDDTIRVMSFNLLAPMYLRKTEYTDQVYPYCTPTHLSWDYRFQLIAKEILAINPDIACLQEVQASKYTDLYTVFPQSEFLLSFWSKKSPTTGDRREGCAIALRKDKFELLERKDVVLSDELLNHPVLGQEWTQHSWASTVETVFQHLGTVGQICTVKEKASGKILAICNTHLFYHGDAGHVRLLQVAKLLEILTQIVEDTGATPIFAGDLNSTPGTACSRLLENREVSADDSIWKRCAEFVWKDEDPDTVEENTREHENKRAKSDGLHLQHNLALTHCFPHLAWTNADQNFSGFLDHILVGPGLEPIQALGVPDLEYIRDLYGGFPNRCYGSDHISVAVDVRVGK